MDIVSVIVNVWSQMTRWERGCTYWLLFWLVFTIVIVCILPDHLAGGVLLDRERAPRWFFVVFLTTAILGQVGGRLSHDSRLQDGTGSLLLILSFIAGMVVERAILSGKLSLPTIFRRPVPVN